MQFIIKGIIMRFIIDHTVDLDGKYIINKIIDILIIIVESIPVDTAGIYDIFDGDLIKGIFV